MSNTPKTDAFLQENYDNDMYFGEESTQDMAEFARGLERQLAEARKVILSVEKAIKLNFHEVKRSECCTETANWVLEKIEQLKEKNK